MEFFGHLLLGIFIALIVFAALTFGFALFIWFAAFAVAVSVLIFLRAWMRRLWFLYHARDRSPPQKNARIIDADYRDISDEK